MWSLAIGAGCWPCADEQPTFGGGDGDDGRRNPWRCTGQSNWKRSGLHCWPVTTKIPGSTRPVAVVRGGWGGGGGDGGDCGEDSDGALCDPVAGS